MHLPMYFDDVKRIFNHRFAGELLAIDEFNAMNENVKIDRWRGIPKAAHSRRAIGSNECTSLTIWRRSPRLTRLANTLSWNSRTNT